MTTHTAAPSMFDELMNDIRMSRKITQHHQALLMQFTRTQAILSDHQAQLLAQLHDGLRRGAIRVAI